MTLTAAHGGPFKLLSLRLSSQGPNPGPGQGVLFGGTKANGAAVTQAATIPNSLNGVVVNFTSDFQDVESVRWAMTVNTYHQFDDITAEVPTLLRIPAATTMTESGGPVVVPLQLGAPLTTATQVSWTIANGTAAQPGDYTRPGGAASGTVTIPAGQTVASLLVPLADDSVNEPAETFSISFTSPGAGYYMPVAATTVTIRNDDTAAGFPGWMSGHGLAGNNALAQTDPNGDGISNIEAWLFRLNPAGASPASWMARRPQYVPAGGYPAPAWRGLRRAFPRPPASSRWEGAK